MSAAIRLLAQLLVLILLPFVVLARGARRINWLAVASDLVLLICVMVLLFTCWIAVNVAFYIWG